MRPKRENGLGPQTRHVLLTMSTYASNDGSNCFPSLRLLAEATALARNTVAKHIDLAKSRGWLVIHDRRGSGISSSGRKGKGWKRNGYILVLPPAFHVEHGGSKQVSHDAGEYAINANSEGGSNAAHKVAQPEEALTPKNSSTSSSARVRDQSDQTADANTGLLSTLAGVRAPLTSVLRESGISDVGIKLQTRRRRAIA